MMRLSLASGVVAVASFLAAGWPAPAHAQFGSIKGQVLLEGDVPTLKPLVLKGDGMAKDAAVCAANGVPDESLVVDAKTKGIANVVVYLRKKPAKIDPKLAAPPAVAVKYDQVGCRFVPHIAIVQTGQTVNVLNSDAIAHNTRANPLKNTGFNFIVSMNDQMGVPVNAMKQPELVPVSVGCDIHSWMRGWWLVVDHPYAAITKEDGTFQIDGLPEGENEFRVWQERIGYVEKSLKVNVKAGDTKSVPTIKVPVATLLEAK